MTLPFFHKTAEKSVFRISGELSPLSAKHSSPTKKHEQSHPYSAKHAVQQNMSGISKAALKGVETPQGIPKYQWNSICPHLL